MRLLSSSQTVIYKWVMPVIWLGFLGLIFLGGLFNAISGKGTGWFLLAPVGMACFGLLIFRIFAWGLMDEVWEDGDWLIIRNRGREARVGLRNIINVDRSMFVNPPQVVLNLREPCIFGDRVKFAAPRGFFPFARNTVMDEFIRRVDQSRHQAR